MVPAKVLGTSARRVNDPLFGHTVNGETPFSLYQLLLASNKQSCKSVSILFIDYKARVDRGNRKTYIWYMRVDLLNASSSIHIRPSMHLEVNSSILRQPSQQPMHVSNSIFVP
jgi:hypothetical protein